ncbi:hypothetical protein [Stutzerimonas xanthomarina]|uniref:hypothetical protein n=1 Tax=Stutzerimonas xanthomarina TaxID=271420 RepID=UPI003AA8BD9D
MKSLETFNPVLIQAYPSSIYAIASWMIENNVNYSGGTLKAIVTSSETLDKIMQERIEKAFGCRVFDWYGQAERVAAIGTCEFGNHHILTDYSMVELLHDHDDYYELVGSSYNNSAMNIAHYRTGDIVKVKTSLCNCGRIFPMVQDILGRRDKTISFWDGRQISRLGHVFKGVDHVIEGQVVYRGGDCLVLRVVPASGWNVKDAERLKKQLRDRVGDVFVKIETTDRILRGANGKFEFIRVEEEA